MGSSTTRDTIRTTLIQKQAKRLRCAFGSGTLGAGNQPFEQIGIATKTSRLDLLETKRAMRPHRAKWVATNTSHRNRVTAGLQSTSG